MKQYAREHEWVEKTENGSYRVGITDFAQEQLGDVVSVELPENGQEMAKGADCAVVESVKAASDVYAPVSGTITAVNEALIDNPGLVNEEPEGGGWLWEMTLLDEGELSGLMDEDAYKKFVEEEK